MANHFTLISLSVRQNAARAIMNAPECARVTIADPVRSNDQNARLWAMLAEISKQATLRGDKFHAEEWKCIFMRALNIECPFLPNLDGKGFFPMGYRSSQMSKREMSDLQTFIEAWGAENRVIFSDNRRENSA